MTEEKRNTPPPPPQTVVGEPVLYVSEQQLAQCIGTYLPTRKEAEGNFQLALYRHPAPANHVLGWTKVPEELPLQLLKSINIDNQVLAYENGRYYNAWFEFEPSEGGWLWTDDADSEPNPSHYRLLSEVALSTATPETKP